MPKPYIVVSLNEDGTTSWVDGSFDTAEDAVVAMREGQAAYRLQQPGMFNHESAEQYYARPVCDPTSDEVRIARLRAELEVLEGRAEKPAEESNEESNEEEVSP